MTATLEEADDYRLLSLANGRRRFGLEFGLVLDAGLQDAFERGVDLRWFDMVDLSPSAASGGVVLRVFRLTDAGAEHLDRLRGKVGTA